MKTSLYKKHKRQPDFPLDANRKTSSGSIAAIVDKRPVTTYQRRLRESINARSPAAIPPFPSESQKKIPASPCGTHLLSEGSEPTAADTPAPAATSDTPVQRKVGFEFQADNSVTLKNEYDKHKRDFTHRDSEDSFPDGADFETMTRGKLIGRNNTEMFDVELDTGRLDLELEILTNPVDETTNGRYLLERQMIAIADMTAGIARHAGPVSELAAGRVVWETEMDDYYFDVIDSVSFHPQATVGIKFEKIGELIALLTDAPFRTAGEQKGEENQPRPQHNIKALYAHEIGWRGGKNKRELRAAWSKGHARAREGIAAASQRNNKEVSENAYGFAAILYSFYEMDQGTSKIDLDATSHLKFVMPFLFRMGLKPFYNTLTPDEIAVIWDSIRHDQIGDARIKLVFKVNNDVYEFSSVKELWVALGLDLDLQDINSKIKLLGYGEREYDEWVGMTSNKDIGRSQSENTTREGALIELRELGDGIPPSQLKEFALNVFDLTLLINQRIDK